MEIVISGLSKSFGNKEVFKDYDLTIPSGRITCLYGASGCGKTTLLNIIGTLERYDSGSVSYDGMNVTNQRVFLEKKVGFIFQNFCLIENESVYKNLMILKKIRKIKGKNAKREFIDKALKQVGLSGFGDSMVYSLSGGEQQRVALAKILLKDCDLILADEPTASLDKDNRDYVVSVLKKWKKEGKTIIVVTHDSMVKDECDYVVNLIKKQKGEHNEKN